MVFAMLFTLFLEGHLQPDTWPRFATMNPTIRHVKESSYQWYKVAYRYEDQAVWVVRDTIEIVLKDGSIVRAKEQYAVTPPPEMRLVKLEGHLPLGDLHQLPYKDGLALMLWCAFPVEVERKQVSEVRFGATSLPGTAAHAPAPRRRSP